MANDFKWNGGINKFPGVQAELGEGPVWHAGEKVFYWIDISGRKLHRLDLYSGKNQSFDMPGMIGALFPIEEGGVVVALETGIFRFRVPDHFELLAEYPLDALPNTRFNDGKCDPAGRLWIGTMDKNAKPYQGKLYRLEGSNLVSVIESVSISNGLAWSPDQQTMYYTDTFEQTVYAFDFNISSGEISGKRELIRISGSMGSPDGLTVDRKGNLWIALWGGHAVACFDPESRQLICKIDIPALNVTSCEFGGPDLDILLITTAREGLNEDQLKQYPLSGHIFFVKTPFHGLQSNYIRSSDL